MPALGQRTGTLLTFQPDLENWASLGQALFSALHGRVTELEGSADSSLPSMCGNKYTKLRVVSHVLWFYLIEFFFFLIFDLLFLLRYLLTGGPIYEGAG